MANNKNNKNGQSTSPFNRSNNIGNKSNQISELDLINVNADKAKKELGDVFSYVNDNLKSLNKKYSRTCSDGDMRGPRFKLIFVQKICCNKKSSEAKGR